MEENTIPFQPIKDFESVTKEWLSQLLSHYYDQPCTVLTFRNEEACKREGFLSEIAYTSVSYELNNHQEENFLVFKFYPNSSDVKNFMIQGELGEREVNFYKFVQSDEFKVVVKNSLLSFVVPEIIYSEVNEADLTIVMKDLKRMNYKTLIIRDGSTLEQTLKSFSSIAIIHAAGLSYFHNHGILPVKKYADTSFYDKYLRSNLQTLIKIFEGETLSNIFKNLLPIAYKMRTYYFEETLFDTVIHGDFWAGQCMYSEDEKDVCILDWQFANVGNPIVDLMGMFFMSSDPDILEHNLEEMIEHYWKELTRNLEKNSVSFSVTYSNFWKSLEKHWMIGFFFITVSLHDFLGSGNISHKRLKGLMYFLHKRSVFSNFINEFQPC